ncbi:hypothetical protein Poli38472_007052 [Pythium oligandrum]|uniref:Uncharacterized protein n=1 Tax=Pythium oligandrum TaxID=41045 RepID=A0A8K1FGP0_PYTOL|nr:hypothetical protein Poli38472_007052 [Pythium oligandrum]|eukprot:TMW58907.1 hypothetical protein Poli38472_007052 [Pythium oligandrum]
MPLWETDELTEAVNVLGLRDRFEPLDLGDESPRPSDNRRSKMEEVYRFDVFGGVAHACLSVSADVVTGQHDLLKEAIDVAGTVDQGAMAQEMFHRVFHYDVSNDISSKPTLQLASEYVKTLLSQRVLGLNEKEKLRSISNQRALFCTNSFTNSASTLCTTSPSISLRDNSYQVNMLELPWVNAVRELESGFTWKDLAPGIYVTPKNKTPGSIDSFYVMKPDARIDAPWSNVDVLLVLVTVSKSHPVEASGLYSVLKQLQIAEHTFPMRVALVFAVPKSRESSFLHQKIVTSQLLRNSSPITHVKGIQTKILNDLAGTEIHTVGDLRRQTAKSLLRTDCQKQAHEDTKKLLRKNEGSAVTEGGDVRQLHDKIPQFVWGI